MKETRMPPAWSANLVANSGNTIYGVSVIEEPVNNPRCDCAGVNYNFILDLSWFVYPDQQAYVDGLVQKSYRQVSNIRRTLAIKLSITQM